MTERQQSTEQKHQSSKPQRAPSNDGPSTLQTAHPIQELQGKIGNAEIARMFADGDEALWARPEVGMMGGPVSNQLAGRIYKSLGGGHPLAHGMQATLESAFGTPLDHVRIHNDAEADALSLSVSASAFTLGNDIFLSHLADPSDEHLLTHEVAHVIQQASMTTSGPLTVGRADDALEHNAEAAASASSAATPTTTTSPTASTMGATVQRDFWETAYNLYSDTLGVVGAGASFAEHGAPGTALGTNAGMLGNVLGPAGLFTGAVGFGQGVDQMLNSRTFGDRLTGGTDALFSGLGAFSGGVGTAGLLGASTPALAPAAAVAGAGAGGYALGRLLDRGVGALGTAITGDNQGDYSISGGLASAMGWADRGISGLFADPDKPAYTQTLGWKLGEWLGI